MTLSAYNVLTAIVNLDSLDQRRFEVKNASALLSDNESNADDDFDISNSKSKIEIIDNQKNITLTTDSIVEI